MSSGSTEEGGDERPRREVAHRIFAAEFDDATLSYSESDEERAPNYVVTPTGARANRLFVAGVLTELDELGNGQLRARIVDPTGAFVVYAGQYQPEALAALERLDPPAFVAVTGKARTFQPEDSNRVFTSIRPESISEIDATIRDRWIVETAARTLDRVSEFAAALVESGSVETAGAERNDGAESQSSGPRSGITLAREHYGTTPAYLAAIRELALDAARVVAGDGEEVKSLDRAPDEEGQGIETDLDALARRPLGGATVATIVDGDGEGPATAAIEAEPTSASGAERSGTGTDGATAVDETATDAASPDESSVAGENAPSEGDDPIASESEAIRDDGIEAVDGAGEDDGFGDAGGSEEAGSLAGDDLGATSIDGEGGEGTEDDDIEDFEGEFDLSDEERAEIEAEYGTDFSTGAEVDDPGEAGIEPDAPTGGDETDGSPDADTVPADLSESEPSGSGSDAGGEGIESEADREATDASAETTDPELDPESQSVSEPEGTLSDPDVEPEGADDEPASEGSDGEAGTVDDEAPPDGSEDAGDIDVTEAVMDAMRELDDGDGADREAVIERVSDEQGVSADEVDDAIQDALMGGQCYEPDDGTLKAI